MRILTFGQARSSAFDCVEWTALEPSVTWDDVQRGGYAHDVYRARFSGDFDAAATALLFYRVFPAHRMAARVCTPDRRITVGATIVQRILLGPIALETAVRVIEVERRTERVSFTYATLVGHAERGIASFAVVREAAQASFEAEVWSRTGHWLTTLGRPVSRSLQRAFTQEAVRAFCDTANKAG